MRGPRLSMVMIARDEKENIERCFDSFWPHVDEVVLVDTGSTDGTLTTARKYAKQRNETRKLVTGTFDWCDDFAAARNYADSLACGDWLAWCDLDDEIVGAEHLRKIAQAADMRGATAIIAPWSLGPYDAPGYDVLAQRTRLVRADRNGGWSGTIDEERVVAGKSIEVLASICLWAHRPDPRRPAGRHLPARERRVEREPENALALAQLAWSLAAAGEHERACAMWRRCFELPRRLPPYLEGLGYRSWGFMLVDAGQHKEARQVASKAIRRAPGTPDAYLAATAIAYRIGDHRLTVRWGKRLLGMGAPESARGRPRWAPSATVYAALPRLWVAASLAELGSLDEAIMVARGGLRIAPDNTELRGLCKALFARAGRPHEAMALPLARRATDITAWRAVAPAGLGVTPLHGGIGASESVRPSAYHS